MRWVLKRVVEMGVQWVVEMVEEKVVMKALCLGHLLDAPRVVDLVVKLVALLVLTVWTMVDWKVASKVALLGNHLDGLRVVMMVANTVGNLECGLVPRVVVM